MSTVFMDDWNMIGHALMQIERTRFLKSAIKNQIKIEVVIPLSIITELNCI